jgi:hypothetical protein
MSEITVRTKEYLQAGALFALFIAIFFYPLIYGRVLSQADVTFFFPPWADVKPADLLVASNPVLNDQTREFLAFFKVARDSLHQKEFPLWNPYIMGGTPLLANSQSALLFPLNWPFYFLPLYLGFTVSALLKMFIACFAGYAFARKISLSHLSSILVGITYAFSIFNVFWLNHPHTNVTIFLPLLLLLAERIKETPSASSMAALGLAVGIQFLGGHVEIAFHVAVAVTLFFLFRLIEYRKNRRAWFLRVKTFVGGYTLGFFFAGVLLLPFLEFLSRSATWQVRSGENPFSLDPLGLISFILPDFFIRPPWPSDISGYHSISLYAGICPLIFSLISLFCVRQRMPLFFAGLSLFALLIVFRIPPFFSLLTSLPLFKQAPNFYMVLFHILSVSLLAGIGVDWVMAIEKNAVLYGRLRSFLMSAGFILPMLAAGSILLVMKTSFIFPAIKGMEGLTSPALGRILYVIGGTLARSAFFAGTSLALLVAVCLVRVPKRLLGALAVVITFADLFTVGSGWNPAIPAEWANPSLPPAVQFLKQDPEVYRVAGIGPVMAPNLATFCNLQDIRGYDVPVGERYHVFFQKALQGKTTWWIYDLPIWPERSLDSFSLMNVKYVLSVGPLPSPLSLVYDKEIKIYENRDVFPRAFLVHKMEIAKDGETAFNRVMALGPELRRVGVLEEIPDPLVRIQPLDETEGKEDRVQITKYSAGHVKVSVETSSPGFLILGDTYSQGWKAYVDGKRVPVYRADYLLRAVPVERGSHRVVFRYRPLSFRIGLGLTLISGVIIFWCLRKRKK